MRLLTLEADSKGWNEWDCWRHQICMDNYENFDSTKKKFKVSIIQKNIWKYTQLLHLCRGHFKKWNTCYTQVIVVLQSGPFRFSHQRSGFTLANALGPGHTWNKSSPSSATWGIRPLFQECRAPWELPYTLQNSYKNP
jgi:hypothetical protein